MNSRLSLLLTALLPACFLIGGDRARAAPPPTNDPKLSLEELERLHALIQPQAGESRWAEIPWMTNLAEARQRAVEEDRPLFVWRAGGGEVLGRA